MILSEEVLNKYVGVMVPLSIIIPIIIALIKYKTLSPELKITSWYLFIGAITGIIYNILSYRKVNNMPISHIYTFVEFTILTAFYKKTLDNNRIVQYMNVIFFSFFFLCVINIIFFQNAYTFNTYTKSIEALVMIFFAVVYFKKILDKIDHRNDKNSSIIYINSGLLLYFSGSFIWFTIYNLTIQNAAFGWLMWSIHATFLLLLYILIAIALWKYKK